MISRAGNICETKVPETAVPCHVNQELRLLRIAVTRWAGMLHAEARAAYRTPAIMTTMTTLQLGVRKCEYGRWEFSFSLTAAPLMTDTDHVPPERVLKGGGGGGAAAARGTDGGCHGNLRIKRGGAALSRRQLAAKFHGRRRIDASDSDTSCVPESSRVSSSPPPDVPADVTILARDTHTHTHFFFPCPPSLPP